MSDEENKANPKTYMEWFLNEPNPSYPKAFQAGAVMMCEHILEALDESLHTDTAIAAELVRHVVAGRVYKDGEWS